MPALPLFPLGTVLFPAAQLPLQVFERRYLALVGDVQDRPREERVFGVVAIRSGHEVGPGAARELFDTGTSARIDAVALVTSPASLVRLLTTGVRRFHLDGIDEWAGTPYLTGQVSWLEEGHVTHADRHLAATLLAEVTAYRAVLGAPPLDTAGLRADVDPGAAGFVAIDAVRLGLADRQRVLDAPDVTSWLRIALALARRERALVERLGSVPQPPDGWSRAAWWN